MSRKLVCTSYKQCVYKFILLIRYKILYLIINMLQNNKTNYTS